MSGQTRFDMPIDRTAELEHKVRLLDNVLFRIAHGRDCEYYDMARQPKPCDCQVCEAKAVLAEVRDWRFIGSRPERVTNGFNPREAKIHAAWKKLVDDRMLGMILYRGEYEQGEPRGHVPAPGARDWYVATSVVQWLATNVGSTVLEAAGFAYTQYDQDRADTEMLRRRQEREKNDLIRQIQIDANKDRKEPPP